MLLGWVLCRLSVLIYSGWVVRLIVRLLWVRLQVCVLLMWIVDIVGGIRRTLLWNVGSVVLTRVVAGCVLDRCSIVLVVLLAVALVF